MHSRDVRFPVEDCIGFEWDDWNSSKNWEKHRVSQEEAESIFFHDPLLLRGDKSHSLKEQRYHALGETPAGRQLLIVFSVRRKLIRVISARNLNRRESEAYARHEKDNP